jgi:diadenosine tetraphosphate (Ap4A) HIT family hydrolase
MPSVGALVAGHVIICPKDHVRSVTALSDTVAADVTSLAAKTSAVLAAKLGMPVHAFEHGSSLIGERVACSVEHAHIHLVPCELDVHGALARVADWQKVDPEVAMLREQVIGREYLTYDSPAGQRWFATADNDGFESQLLRRVFAEALGIAENWNWRAFPQRSNIEATVALFGDAGAATEIVTAAA